MGVHVLTPPRSLTQSQYQWRDHWRLPHCALHTMPGEPGGDMDQELEIHAHQLKVVPGLGLQTDGLRS